MKYIIFDIDGTLTDTTKVDDECYMNSFKTLFGLDIRKVNWSELKNVTDWGITEELIELKLNRKINQEELIELKALFLNNLRMAYEENRNKFKEVDGAAAFYASTLNREEFRIGIATGGWEETANFKLKTIGINPTSVSYSNSNYYKEREKIVLDVIQQLNLNSSSQPEEVIYFSDGEWDYKTCKNLGIRFIGIDNSNNDKLRKLGVAEVYTNFNKPEPIMNSIINSIRQ